MKKELQQKSELIRMEKLLNEAKEAKALQNKMEREAELKKQQV